MLRKPRRSRSRPCKYTFSSRIHVHRLVKRTVLLCEAARANGDGCMRVHGVSLVYGAIPIRSLVFAEARSFRPGREEGGGEGVKKRLYNRE